MSSDNFTTYSAANEICNRKGTSILVDFLEQNQFGTDVKGLYYRWRLLIKVFKMYTINFKRIKRSSTGTTGLIHEWKFLLEETSFARFVRTEYITLAKKVCKSAVFFAEILQDPNISCKILQEFVNDNAFSCKILQKFSQYFCKSWIFSQLGVIPKILVCLTIGATFGRSAATDQQEVS